MTYVLAALDGSLADTPVLNAAHALGDLLDAGVEAINVKVGALTAGEAAAEAAGVPLRVAAGEVVEELARAGEGEDVLALVLGARGLPTDPRPLGATAQAVATRVAKPVLVVPPDGVHPTAIRRILVPLEGTLASSVAPQVLFDLVRDVALEVVALHVLGTEEIPAFTDQPQHEHRAWAREFLARYCPSGLVGVRLEMRIGRPENLVPLVAGECECDLIALGWAQDVAPGRAPVVRAALQLSQRPVLLVPAGAPVVSGAGAEAVARA